MKKNLENSEKMRYLKKDEVILILNRLAEAYPKAGCALKYDSLFHLLIAVILSAQTTDISVNKETPVLFNQYPTAKDLEKANHEDVENCINQLGLYKNKASNIVKMSKMLVEKYNGYVPGTLEKLMELPGVGRKTANVVLSEGFGEQRIAVDTHVFRVANRIGLADADNVAYTEKQLMNSLPKYRWTEAHHLLIFHGRQCCKARKPLCEKCCLSDICKEKKEKEHVQL